MGSRFLPTDSGVPCNNLQGQAATAEHSGRFPYCTERGIMGNILSRMSVGFAAGCLGALVNSWLVWYLGRRGIPQMLGVAIAPKWSLAFLYPRLIWGGLWGLI